MTTSNTTIESFRDQVFQYILHTYGNNTLTQIQSDKNKNIVVKIMTSACNQNYTIEHTANKIVAMLRMNP